jgi:hypothetical protein
MAWLDRQNPAEAALGFFKTPGSMMEGRSREQSLNVRGRSVSGPTLLPFHPPLFSVQAETPRGIAGPPRRR